jgi:hypothetical protein
LTFQ